MSFFKKYFFSYSPRHFFGYPFGCIASVLFVSSLLFGCSSKSQNPLPPEELYADGLSAAKRGAWHKAVLKFKEIDKLYPYSELAKHALVLATYTAYMERDYPEAILNAQRYLQLYPAGYDAAYVQYILGCNYYDQIKDVRHDQKNTHLALKAFNELLVKWPESDYTRSSNQKITFSLNQLAGHEMTIGRYYLKKSGFIGAINRFRTVVANYRDTAYVPEALARLVECYLRLGVIPEVVNLASILHYNFPDGSWDKRVITLLISKKIPLPSADQLGPWLALKKTSHQKS